MSGWTMRRGAGALAVAAVLAAGCVEAASPIPDGDWLGAIDVRAPAGNRKVRTSLELGNGPVQTGGLRFHAPYDCDIDVEFVEGEGGRALYNVTETTATGFCRNYDGGALELTLAGGNASETVDLRLETADRDPERTQTGTLAHDRD